MKKILQLLSLLLPLGAAAQNAAPLLTPTTVPEKHRLLEGFAQVGYVHELWVLTRGLSYGYSSLSYTGNGFYAGGGVRSQMSAARPLGFGLSVDYLQYTMDKTLNETEYVKLGYGFGRITPMVYYTFNTRSRFTFTARGDVGFMLAIKDNERGYIQYGLKGCVGYKAYEANLGFNFSQNNSSPADVGSKWREQMFSLGLVCYPGRIAGFMHKPAPTKK